MKATGDGRMVQVMNAATPQMTRTALRGCPSGDTLETQLEYGRTPSRATAKTRRDAATIAIAVFYICQMAGIMKEGATYKPQGQNTDYVHENMPPFPENDSV